MVLTSEAWRLWAKTYSESGREAGGENQGARLWLALPQHMRDAADVGERLVREWVPRAVQQRLAVACHGTVDEAARLVGFLAGVHDAGKADTAFASQIDGSPEHGWLWEQVRSLPSCPSDPGKAPDPRPRHAEVSDLILRRELHHRFPEVDLAAIISCSSTAGCHHGRLSDLGRTSDPRAGRARELSAWLDRHGPQWAGLWTSMLDDILERTGAAPVLEQVLAAGGLGIADQLLLCGLITAADWIASNQELFPLTESGRHPSDDSRADDALQRLRLTRAWQPEPTTCPPFRRRFSWPESAELRPCQRAAVEAAASSDGPCLLIIEEEMGQGKTEAALLAAEILAGNLGSGGVAFALPTMATADSMFSRVRSWVETLEDDGSASHSLFLGHSRAWLEPENERLIRQTRSVNGRGTQAVVAHEWFTGKRGMLAEFTVSTIDQVLMTALATRYVTMRHLGVAGKVVILDEVHSYDVFTSGYLVRTLTWLAAHGVSVILLSATLASGLRQQLEDAYAEGLGANPVPESATPAPSANTSLTALKGRGRRRQTRVQRPDEVPQYPRISLTGQYGVRFTPIEQRTTHRQVEVRVLDDALESLGDLLLSALQHGGVAGVVCNTVRRAQKVYEQLREDFGEETVELHHSQFTAWDRSDREKRLVSALGPSAHRGTGRPERFIVVGTQVLEQSLDIDFDLLITDLAPGDSLAQRAGRLHRHARPTDDRPAGLSSPVLYIRGVDMAGPVPVPDAGATAVYGDRVLLATLAALQPFLDGQPWCLTHELESVVENIYGPAQGIPDTWRDAYDRAAHKEDTCAAESRQRSATFQLTAPAQSQGYLTEVFKPMIAQDAERSESVALAHARDIEPSVEVLLVQEKGGLLSPLPGALPQSGDRTEWSVTETAVPPPRFARAVAMSSVRLPRWLVAPWDLDAAIAELEDQGLRAWQADFRLRGQLVLRLDEELRGELLGKSFRYDPRLGIHPVELADPDTSDPWCDDMEEYDVMDDQLDYGKDLR